MKFENDTGIENINENEKIELAFIAILHISKLNWI